LLEHCTLLSTLLREGANMAHEGANTTEVRLWASSRGHGPAALIQWVAMALIRNAALHVVSRTAFAP
jgi:hypothetical protein